MDEIKILSCEEIEGKICEEVKIEEIPNLLDTIDQMIAHCIRTGAGGLAAPQIGIFKNFFVFMKKEGEYLIAFNPKMYGTGKKLNVIETCLSCIEGQYLMRRFKEIQAVYFEYKNGNLCKKGIPFKGVAAVIFQHELGHLSGITIKFHGFEVKRNGKEN